ncbi:hypothetical protein FIA58_004610 [Flavobacterium jejuense]|uniref:Uncharacterized protein n=1 Tax=Flavobacterium jejuense TaxID=1544455 RepID=A0ABX0IML2_9FLAO|nr:hypothetical protein [Flavobacterium jejuense]NHN24953.1 hypothetical protein [Flavobacterium jejuense]
MNSFYIYRFEHKKNNENGENYDSSTTVIFCPGESINNTNLQTEIRLFYEKYHHTDEIIVIGGNNIKDELIENFITNQSDTFKYLHKVDKDYLASHLFVFAFNANGSLIPLNSKTISDNLEKKILNEGSQNIFINRGGFVESKGAHHFVFPSGKHCNKFLRTGNILLHSSEIYFIGFTLLKFYNVEKHNQIYCDTSSINTIAFSLIDLKRRLIGSENFKSIPIESFSSYTGLQSSKKINYPKALILISASTSGNILKKIKKNNRLAKKENMIILFYLGDEEAYIENENNILCNLTKNDVYNPTGIDYYDTYDSSDCIHCDSGSYPVNVMGDVFLLEKPKINPITLTVRDVPKDLSKFVYEFKSVELSKNNIFKVSYKENEREINKKYEIYFDFLEVIKDIKNKKYKAFSSKLDNYINQYIPSNTKYLIYLNDEGSKILAERILYKIKHNYNVKFLPEMISQDELDKINPKDIGSVVVVASCISNGKNLLYLSRSLRPIDGLRIIYFIGLTRTINEQHLNFLKSNLKQGRYGIETYTFINVYNFYMINQSIDTTWLREIEFLRNLKIFNEEKNNDKKIFNFLNSRINYLENGMNDQSRGMSNQIFYPNFIKEEELKLRKNFAFLSFNDLSQSDVYFTISSIINHLRNSNDLNRCLKQTEYVRNMIEPGNFNRFNDGIIQASILRIANKDELAYSLDYDLSKKMLDILSTMIKNYKTDQGEGLFEFIYALATQNLTLYKIHLIEICKMIKENINNNIYLFFILYIESKVIPNIIN